LIVVKFYAGPINLFSFVFLLFLLENVLIELLLQFLIGVVDAKLLETVYLHTLRQRHRFFYRKTAYRKVFKTKDIQYTNKGLALCCFGLQDRLVDLLNQPIELPSVKRLRKSISYISRLQNSQFKLV